jgi:hypothetical protein
LILFVSGCQTFTPKKVVAFFVSIPCSAALSYLDGNLCYETAKAIMDTPITDSEVGCIDDCNEAVEEDENRYIYTIEEEGY